MPEKKKKKGLVNTGLDNWVRASPRLWTIHLDAILQLSGLNDVFGILLADTEGKAQFLFDESFRENEELLNILLVH